MKKRNMLIDCRGKNCSPDYDEIEENFKSINEGQAIRLITDSNPQKLYFKMLSKERGNFYWALFEDGPKEWDVLIEKVSAI